MNRCRALAIKIMIVSICSLRSENSTLILFSNFNSDFSHIPKKLFPFGRMNLLRWFLKLVNEGSDFTETS